MDILFSSQNVNLDGELHRHEDMPKQLSSTFYFSEMFSLQYFYIYRGSSVR